MYKQRPAYPALLGAVASLLLGGCSYFMIYHRVQSGEIGPEKLVAMIAVSVSISGLFLIAAFARYQFIHLWRNPRREKGGRR